MSTCVKYTIKNTSKLIPITISWRNCNGQPVTRTLRRNGSTTICALNNSVTSNFKTYAQITRTCTCTNAVITNISSFNYPYEYVDCNGVNRTVRLVGGQSISVCLCASCFTGNEPNPNFTISLQQRCISLLPVSPTPSITPTRTPAALSCSYGLTDDSGNWFYVDCCGNLITGITVNTQVCYNPNFANAGIFPIYSACTTTCVSPTPTPSSQTPTPTPTPTNTATPTLTPTVTPTCSYSGTAFSVIIYTDLESFCAQTGGTPTTVYTRGVDIVPTPSSSSHLFSNQCCTIPATSDVIYEYSFSGFSAFTAFGDTDLIYPEVICPTPTPTPTPTITESPTPTPTNTLTPTPTSTPCECLEYKWNATQHDINIATGNTGSYNNNAVYLDYDLCEPGCAGPGSGNWRTGGSIMGTDVFTVTWCQPQTGYTNTPDGPYVYIDNVKTYTGLTSNWSATTTCCSGSTQIVTYGYIFKQSEGVPPGAPSYSGETVFYNNDLVTYDVDTLTGFSLNLIDLWDNNTNECNALPEISGLTQNGGQIYFSQFGNTAGFSGDSTSFSEDLTGFSGSNLTLIQSAGTPFSASSSIDVWFIVNLPITPTPTPTNTPTPTPVYFEYTFASGNTFGVACGLPPVLSVYSSSSILSPGDTLWYDTALTEPANALFYSNGSNYYQMAGNTIAGGPIVCV